MNREARLLAKCQKLGVSAPTVYRQDNATSSIIMEYIDGIALKHVLQDPVTTADEKARLGSDAARLIGTLHTNNIIHGDFTTSNFLVRRSDRHLFVIDFGLSYMSPSAEDKAVDLYVLERAFISSHPDDQHILDDILTHYEAYSSGSSAVMKRLQAVRLRGRKRDMIGWWQSRADVYSFQYRNLNVACVDNQL